MEIRITEQHITSGADGELWDGYVMAIWENNHIEFVEPVRIELESNCDKEHEPNCEGYNYFINTPWGKLTYCTEGTYSQFPISLTTTIN
jgi:hypothetical protein